MKQKELSRWLRVVVIIGWCACALLAWPIAPKLAQDAGYGFIFLEETCDRV